MNGRFELLPGSIQNACPLQPLKISNLDNPLMTPLCTERMPEQKKVQIWTSIFGG
jgi:hypothetical protein